MDLNAIAQGAAAIASTISGIRGASPWEVDTIPGTPYVVVGMPKGDVTPGDRRIVRQNVPLRLYVERIANSARDARTTLSYVATFLSTYALDQDLGGAATVANITAYDSDVYYVIGGATYAAVDFTLTVQVNEYVPNALRTKL